MKEELWKPVVGYEGVYEVSDMGRIRGLNRKCETRIVLGTILKPHIWNGYLRVVLRRGGNRKTWAVHRIVLIAFAGPNPPLMEACHKNGIRSDNRLVNLRWGSRKENAADRVRHGTLSGELNGFAKLTYENVADIRALLRDGTPRSEVAKRYGVHKDTIRLIHLGKRWGAFRAETRAGGAK